MKEKNEIAESLWIYLALVVLLMISIGLRSFDFGILQSILLLAIAGLEGLLVFLFFMRVRVSSQLTWLVAGGGFLWLGILLTLTLGDYLSRSWWR
jgi:cytochrome c oxidase subunit 4